MSELNATAKATGEAALPPATGSVRLVEVTMKFWKVFHVTVPEGVTVEDVLESDMVDNERSSDWDVDREHDETTAKEHFKTDEEIARLKNHEKVFSWKQAQGE